MSDAARFVVTVHSISAPRPTVRIEVERPAGCDPIPVKIVAMGSDCVAFVWRMSTAPEPSEAATPIEEIEAALDPATGRINWLEACRQGNHVAVAWITTLLNDVILHRGIELGAGDAPLRQLADILKQQATRISTMHQDRTHDPVDRKCVGIDLGEFATLEELCWEACITSVRLICRTSAAQGLVKPAPTPADPV